MSETFKFVGTRLRSSNPPLYRAGEEQVRCRITKQKGADGRVTISFSMDEETYEARVFPSELKPVNE